MSKLVAMIQVSVMALACLLTLAWAASGAANDSSEAAFLEDTAVTPAPAQGGEDRSNIAGPAVDPVAGQARRRTGCERCLPLIRCAFAYNAGERPPGCVLKGGGPGVCCPRRAPSPPALDRHPLLSQPLQDVAMADVPLSIINNSSRYGVNEIANTIELEDYLLRTHQYLDHQTAARGHFNFFRVTHEAVMIHRDAQRVWKASSLMAKALKLTKQQRKHGLRRFSVASSLLSNVCPTEPVCDPSAPYRTVDGSCNNLAKPLYGRSHTAFQRIRAARYEDGVNSPKALSVTGIPLPPVRTISNTVLLDRNVPDLRITLSVMQYSQFIDHDLTHSPFPALNDNTEGIDCCPQGAEATGPTRHPSCFPIPVPENDPFYGPRSLRCLNFVRSMQALNQNCTFGVAEQMNQVTHPLDSSNVYGSLQSQADRLRVGEGGLLPTTPGNLLPYDPERKLDCDARQRGAICYFAGDSRVNEMPGLTALHILYHRQHNWLAQGLAEVNPSWQDERLFQEAKRINNAIYQHIVFNEWLPVLIGQSTVERYGLGVGRPGFSTDYDELVNPNIQNEFAVAAFRFGHTLVQGVIRLYDENDQVNVLRLRDHFNSPHIYQARPGTVDLFARALIRESSQTYDAFITEDLSKHLFQTPIHDFGMDLMSLNLQRARDHAISSYNDIREACGLTRARTFGDFNDQIKMDVINRLREVYAHPDDVELFMGGISETSAGDGLLGFTFRCVVADAFARIKRGDRFFYDQGGQTGSFKRAQLRSIQGMSWARLICDNTDTVRRVQPLGFLAAEEGGLNALQDCAGGGIPELDFSLWKE